MDTLEGVDGLAEAGANAELSTNNAGGFLFDDHLDELSSVVLDGGGAGGSVALGEDVAEALDSSEDLGLSSVLREEVLSTGDG